MTKIMAQIRINKPEYSVANLRANSNAIEERDFPEEQQSSAISDAAIPKIGVNNTDYDTSQKQEISQPLETENSRKVVGIYSDFYLNPLCSQKLTGQESSQRLFPQTKTKDQECVAYRHSTAPTHAIVGAETKGQMYGPN